MTIALYALLASGHASADPLAFSSGPTRTALVELYTSEGCNSCPPADRWLGELVDDDGLWIDFVPVAFHVTYWNYLGWEDAYSDPAFDLRQRRAARRAGSGVYTPGMFLDGDEWRAWRRGASPDSVAEDAAGELDVRLDGDALSVRFAQPRGALADDRLIARVAWLSGASTDVARGENRGRRLRHEFTVRRLDRVPLLAAEGALGASVTLTPPAADDSPALAVWVEDRYGRVLQATGGWLPAHAGAVAPPAPSPAAR